MPSSLFRSRSSSAGLAGETVLLLVSLFWTLTCHRPFFTAALQGRDLAEPSAWGWALALGTALTALNLLVLPALALRYGARTGLYSLPGRRSQVDRREASRAALAAVLREEAPLA